MLTGTKSKNINYYSNQSISYTADVDQCHTSGLDSAYTRFYEDLIQFYSNNVSSNFNYEDFFDFYYPYKLSTKNYDDNSIKSLKTILPDALITNENLHTLFQKFHNIYSQLIAIFLTTEKFYEDVSLGNYPLYDFFAFLVLNIIRNGHAYIHSLNHDILLDFILSRRNGLSNNFSDGFDDLGSPYYGVVSFDVNSINKEYKARLRYYSGIFSGKIQLFKLHGSIDTETLLTEDVRIKKIPRVFRYLKEINVNNRYEYTGTLTETFPEFLTGKKFKDYFYKLPYFENLIEKFKNNLNSSKLLIIIEYGFGDEPINKIIEENFDLKNKNVVIIDTADKTSLLSRITFEIPKLFYFQKSISSIETSELNQILSLL